MNRNQFSEVIKTCLVSFILLETLGSGMALGQTSLDLGTLRSTALSAHNTYRAKHHSPPMTLSDSLNNSAQTWAQHLVTIGKLEHSRSGENLYVSYTTEASIAAGTLANEAVKSWYNEVSSYNYSKPGFSPNTGHFTQVVWKSSTQLGCGAARGTATIRGTRYNAFYVVCHYAPAGNVTGQFPSNVLKP